MFKRILTLIFLFCSSVYFSSAQTSDVKGILIDEFKAPIPLVKMILVGTDIKTTTDSNGTFQFKNVPYGVYTVETNDELMDYFLVGVKIEQPAVDLSALSFEKKNKSTCRPG